MNVRHAAELALVLRRTLGENVTLRSVGALDRAAGARLETLGGGALGLHLRHLPFPLLFTGK